MSFESFLAERGLVVKAPVSDGRVHRCATYDHPKRRNGAYQWDGRRGWAQNWEVDRDAVFWRDGESTPQVDRETFALLMKCRREEEQRMRARAADKARKVITAAKPGPHAYLRAKGFGEAPGLVHEDKLVIPMWNVGRYAKDLFSIQTIEANGTKKFLYGGRTRGAVYRFGPGTASEHWLVEGYATGLSVMVALRFLHRLANVFVCFSASNLVEIARVTGGFVVADNDVSGTGQAAALATGLPYVLPPDKGTDFNDYHQRAGLPRAADLLRSHRLEASRVPLQ